MNNQISPLNFSYSVVGVGNLSLIVLLLLFLACPSSSDVTSLKFFYPKWVWFLWELQQFGVYFL